MVANLKRNQDLSWPVIFGVLEAARCVRVDHRVRQRDVGRVVTVPVPVISTFCGSVPRCSAANSIRKSFKPKGSVFVPLDVGIPPVRILAVEATTSFCFPLHLFRVELPHLDGTLILPLVLLLFRLKFQPLDVTQRQGWIANLLCLEKIFVLPLTRLLFWLFFKPLVVTQRQEGICILLGLKHFLKNWTKRHLCDASDVQVKSEMNELLLKYIFIYRRVARKATSQLKPSETK